MRFGSLFSGIGGMDLGLERAGMQCAWQVEIDDYATKVLAKHWPAVPRFRDVRECGRHNLASVDLIAGGFPCQDISNAGKRAGIDGERSGLWSEFHRIICELRPRFVLVENVAALLGRGMGRVLGDLAASGYDAEWDVLPASAFGAPHIRERVFILAYTAHVGTGRRQQFKESSEDAGYVADAFSAGLSVASRAGIRVLSKSPESFSRCELCRRVTETGRAWEVEPTVGRVANGIPDRVDQIRGLGNAVVPQVAEWIGRRILEAA
jgi:DNA (cytosine-5)-methyltransferase 1